MELPDICHECGYTRPAHLPAAGGDVRGLVTVVAGTDVRRVCTWCVLQMLPRVNRGLNMTLVL